MFKEQYKAANNSIPVNEELLKSLMAKAERPQKVIKFKNIYKIGTAVAAVLVLAVSISAITFLGNDGTSSPKEKKPSTKIAVSTPAPNEAKTITSAEMAEDKADSINDTADNQTAPAETIPEKIEVETEFSFSKNEPVYAARTITENSVQKIEISDEESEDTDTAQNSTLAIASDMDKSAPVPESAGGGSSSVMARKQNSMELSEYLNIFGIDISKIVLPQGVTANDEFITPSYSPDGSISFEDFSLSFSGGDKTLTLTVSQGLSSFSDGISTDENGKITAYITVGDISFMAEGYNFTYEEMKAFASSLK